MQSGHLTGTSLSFSIVCRGHLLSPSSWPRTVISLGRHPFYLLLRQPKGLVSCTSSPSGFVIRMVGGPALLCSFLTSLPKHRILLCLTLCFEEFTIPSLDDFVGMTGASFFSVPFDPSGNTCFGLSTFIQGLRASLSPLVVSGRGCPVTPFLFGSAQLSPCLMLLRRIVITQESHP